MIWIPIRAIWEMELETSWSRPTAEMISLEIFLASSLTDSCIYFSKVLSQFSMFPSHFTCWFRTISSLKDSLSSMMDRIYFSLGPAPFLLDFTN